MVSSEDVKMLSLEELRVELTAARNMNKELVVKLAQKTEESQRLKLDSSKQPSHMASNPEKNKEPSANREPRWKIFKNVTYKYNWPTNVKQS